jgi:hypothetical protein
VKPTSADAAPGTGAPCVVSVADHTGWAHVVCVASRGHSPAVVERRRIALIDAGLPTQPYEHDTSAMREDDANALIAKVRRSVAARSLEALQRLAAELAPAHTIVALAIRQPPFAALPATVAEARRSDRVRNSADGMIFQLAICHAARQLGLAVHLCRRREEAGLAAERLGVSADAVEEFVARSGRPPGPPWTEEHRRAYAAGIAVLATHVRNLTIPTA